MVGGRSVDRHGRRSFALLCLLELFEKHVTLRTKDRFARAALNLNLQAFRKTTNNNNNNLVDVSGDKAGCCVSSTKYLGTHD
jgi:hypothetical protein